MIFYKKKIQYCLFYESFVIIAANPAVQKKYTASENMELLTLSDVEKKANSNIKQASPRKTIVYNNFGVVAIILLRNKNVVIIPIKGHITRSENTLQCGIFSLLNVSLRSNCIITTII